MSKQSPQTKPLSASTPSQQSPFTPPLTGSNMSDTNMENFEPLPPASSTDDSKGIIYIIKVLKIKL